MSLQPHHQKAIDEFLDAIRACEPAYRGASFAYLAIKNCSGFTLLQGVVYLRPFPKRQLSQFASDNVRAGHCLLSDLKLSLEQFIEKLLTGTLALPCGDVGFPAPTDGQYTTWLQPFHPAGLQNQNRMMVLQLKGADQAPYIRQPFLDWELKAGEHPFDSLQELMNDCGVGGLFNERATIEIFAPNVAAIDFSSPVQGTSATLIARLASGLNVGKFAMGIRIAHQGQVVERMRKDGSAFEWEAKEEYQEGRYSLTLPQAAHIHCIANYDGVAQHYGWLADPATTQNPRRAVYETFDPKLSFLVGICQRRAMKGQKARELESAVSWLLWMLGFSVTQLGDVSEMQDAADLLVTAPNGHFAVVEVTTGTLKAENKLSLLQDRAQAVRRNLDASGNQHLRMMTIIITSQPRSDIEVDLEQAEKLGILVMTQEDIQVMIDRSRFLQNADKLFEEAEGRVKFGQGKFEPRLPGV